MGDHQLRLSELCNKEIADVRSVFWWITIAGLKEEDWGSSVPWNLPYKNSGTGPVDYDGITKVMLVEEQAGNDGYWSEVVNVSFNNTISIPEIEILRCDTFQIRES